MFATFVMFRVIVVLLLYFRIIKGAEVVPERVEVSELSAKFFSNVVVSVKRNSRKSPYFLNVEGTLLQPFGDNVTVNNVALITEDKFHGVFYEYLHNEYRRGFVEVNLKLCDLYHKEPWKSVVGAYLVQNGAKCPFTPGFYKYHNITASLDKLPFVFPFEKAMLGGFIRFEPTQEVIGRGRYYFAIKGNKG